MRRVLGCCAAAALFAAWQAQAMMAPKYERARALAAAFDHLSEIAALLADPIDRIEFVDGVVRFSAGRCFVPVRVDYDSGPSSPPLPGGGGWNATVGVMQCR